MPTLKTLTTKELFFIVTFIGTIIVFLTYKHMHICTSAVIAYTPRLELEIDQEIPKKSITSDVKAAMLVLQ